MIKLNINKSKKINFDINTNDFKFKDLEGFLRLKVEGIEYGFPVNIENNSISVDLPPLSDIIKNGINEGENIGAVLDIVSGDMFIKLWKGKILIENNTQVKVDTDKFDIKKVDESHIKNKDDVEKFDVKEEKSKFVKIFDNI